MSSNAPSRPMLWVGRGISVLPVLAMLMSGGMKLLKPAQVGEMFTGKFGYPASTLMPIGILELACVLLYLIPQTSILGAVLVTGYLGGTIATHVRVGDPYWMPLILGIVVWAGLVLREPRLRALLPLRRPAA